MVVEKRIPLTEINKWDLDDIRNAYSVIEMRNDYSNAISIYDEFKAKQE